MLPLRTRRSAGLIIIALSMLLALVVAAPVAAKNPPGNNGTIKLDTAEWDNHPNNEPHVDCEFQVDFYGFDADPDPANPTYFAQVIFELHPPTAAGRTMTVMGGSLTPFIGGDDNSGVAARPATTRRRPTRSSSPATRIRSRAITSS